MKKGIFETISQTNCFGLVKDRIYTVYDVKMREGRALFLVFNGENYKYIETTGIFKPIE